MVRIILFYLFIYFIICEEDVDFIDCDTIQIRFPS